MKILICDDYPSIILYAGMGSKFGEISQTYFPNFVKGIKELNMSKRGVTPS